jgi:hypothetical protein
MVQLHQLDEAGVEDRLDAIAEHRLLLLVIAGAPEVVLAPTDEVARLREGRHPLAVLEHRVPADVVDVQVRAYHGVDAVARPAHLTKMLQERRRQRLAAGDLARPIVSDAGVDDQLQPRRLDQQRVDAEFQSVVVLADEVRIEPRDLRSSAAVACGMTEAGTGKSISTMRVIFTRPTCQLSSALTPLRPRLDPTEV